MIDVKTYEENNCRKFRSQIEGTMDDICMDAAHIMRGIYDAIKQSCQSDAEFFREFLTECARDPMFFKLENNADESLIVDLADIKSGGPA